jgi:predicted nucleotidyltransferase
MAKEKEIKQITDRIVKNHNPEKIFLFGSFAWGHPHKDSDIDLLVVKKGIKSMRQAAIEVDRSFPDRETAMDILVCTPDHLEKRLTMGDFFAKRIVNKGKLLYEKK